MNSYFVSWPWRHGYSRVFRFATALARKHKAELVTGDPEFKAVEKEIKVNWLK